MKAVLSRDLAISFEFVRVNKLFDSEVVARPRGPQILPKRQYLHPNRPEVFKALNKFPFGLSET